MNVAYEQLIRMLVLVFVFLVIAATVAVATIVYFTITTMTIKCDHCKKRKPRSGSETLTLSYGHRLYNVCKDCINKS